MSLVAELKRRNVFQVAAAYLVVGWLLTEVLTTILPTVGAPEWMSRAVILVFALGFIPAVVLSWVYELTPDGIKRDHEVQGESSVTQSPGFSYSVIGVVIALVIVIAVLGAQNPLQDDTSDGALVSDASVAVLPFVNMSNDPDNEYFSDGLTETLLHMLAQVPQLQVAARTSSFAFKDQNVNVGEIATALNVAHVLEGSVQKSGNRVRVTAQLIRASDGFHVWSSSYDREIDDIFAIQDEIAGKVGSALSVSLLGQEVTETIVAGISTDNTDAYDLYLQALKERATFSFGGLQAEEDLLKGALTIDSQFLDAKIELADNYRHQVETGLLTADDGYRQIKALADQVLQVEPENPNARAIRLFADIATLDLSANPTLVFDTIAELQQLLEENPAEYRIRVLLTRLLTGTQQPEEALRLQQQALKADPYNARIHYEVGSAYSNMQQWDEAREALRRSLAIEPMQPNVYVQLALIGMKTGDGLEFVQQLLRAMEVDPKDHELPGYIAQFLYRIGLVEEGDDFRDRVMAIAPTSEVAYQIELQRARAVGDREAGLASARRAIADDIDDRQFSYGGAVQYLLRDAAQHGTVEQTSAWLEQQAPGILQLDAELTDNKYRNAQYAALDAWYVSLPRDELLARIEKMLADANELGVDILKDPVARMQVAALTDDTEEAIEVALNEVLTKPVESNLDWKATFAQPQYADVVADSRVQKAFKAWEDQLAELRGQVSRFLADLSSSAI